MKLTTLSAVSSVALAIGMAAPAFAQDNADGGHVGTRTTEIVVTADFRAANLQDTPIAITAVNAEMLDARGQTDISQVAAQAPNVTLRPQPQNGGSGLIAFIRGVGQTDFNYALDPGVGVYIDDVYIPTLSSSLLELIDLTAWKSCAARKARWQARTPSAARSSCSAPSPRAMVRAPCGSNMVRTTS